MPAPFLSCLTYSMPIRVISVAVKPGAVLADIDYKGVECALANKDT